MLAAPERPGQVRGDEIVPELVRRLVQPAFAEDAGVVDDEVERTVLGTAALDRCDDVLFLPDVALEEDRLAAADLDSSTAAWPASAFRARATTRAPSATASSRISRPRPLEAPVTTPALPASRTLCLRLDLVQELFARDDRVGEVVVHPGKVLPAGLDDAQRVPGRDVLLVGRARS